MNNIKKKENLKKDDDVLHSVFFSDKQVFFDALMAGKPSAQAEFYNRYSNYVEKLIMRVMGMDDENEDLVQEVFLHAIKALPWFRGEINNLKHWLTRIAVNRVRQKIRYRKARWWLQFAKEDTKLQSYSPQAGQDIVYALKRVYILLDKLSADIRIVFTLKIIENMELAEIANICGISVSTVKRRFNYARVKFFKLAQEDKLICDWLDGYDE